MFVPINLNLREKEILIVGGGKIAFKKAEMFLRFGCNISMVAREVSHGEMSKNKWNSIQFFERDFEENDLKNKRLVIIATNDSSLNEYIASECRKNDVLFCDSSGTVESDFSLPALVKRGDLSITIGTNGKSPAMSKKIKKEIEGIYGEEYEVLLSLLGELRMLVLEKESNPEVKRNILTEAITMDIEELRNYIEKYKGEIR